MSSVRASSNQHPERSPRVQLRLRVLGGMHAGAEFRMPERGILMIGRADDCDLILGDDGIAEHHCVLTVMGEQVMLRALDGDVDTDERRIAPGQSVSLEHFAMARLGDMRFAVGSHWSERWQSLSDASDTGASVLTERQLARRRQGVLASAGLLLLVAILVLFGSWRVTHSASPVAHDASEQLQQTRAILQRLSLRHVSANVDGSGRLVVRGVVDKAAQLPTLKRSLSGAGLATELTVRDWPSVAKQVSDIFAMHGYTVETRLDQDVVEVSGHFGDGTSADKVKRDVLGSSDMQSLNSDVALNLALRNYDERPAEAPKPDPAKRIRHVYRGNDEYVVTADDSHYYPGGTLPQGGKFIHVTDSDDILIKTADDKYAELSKEDDYAAPHPLSDEAVAALVQPAASSTTETVDTPVPEATAKAKGVRQRH